MTDDAVDPELIRRYRAWIAPHGGARRADREAFYTTGVIVLDTNVLLDLYRYTPSARAEVFAALELVAERLWMPYQVGLEFVRGRNKVIDDRVKLLSKAAREVRDGFDAAWKDIAATLAAVKGLLAPYSTPSTGEQDLDQLITQQQFQAMMDPWKQELIKRTEQIRDAEDVQLGSLVSGTDRVLQQVAQLYGERIAEAPSSRDLRKRVEWAAQFRFPNEIPPGFADSKKGTDLAAAGDLLLWEEVVRHAAGLPEPRRVLLVSRDGKKDWYEPSGPGRPEQPWPHLYDEMQRRGRAGLLIVRPQEFFEDIGEYLHATLAPGTVEEIGKAAEADGREPAVSTEEEAYATAPPREALVAACRAAELPTSVQRHVLSEAADPVFQWWLIGVTVLLGLRSPADDEPGVDLEAATLSADPPERSWQGGDVFPLGQWPYRSSSWIAPWFVRAVKAVPLADRASLLRLEVRQLDFHSMEQDAAQANREV